jgi:hypothetical protein
VLCILSLHDKAKIQKPKTQTNIKPKMKTIHALILTVLALSFGQMSTQAENKSTEQSAQEPVISKSALHEAIDSLAEQSIELGTWKTEQVKQTWNMVISVYGRYKMSITRTVADSNDDGDTIVHQETGLDTLVPGSGFTRHRDWSTEPIADDKIPSLVKSKTGRHTVKYGMGNDAFWFETSDWDPTGTYETNHCVHLTISDEDGVKPDLDPHSIATEITFEYKDKMPRFTVTHTQKDMTKAVLVFRCNPEYDGGYRLDTVSKTRELELSLE